MRPTDQLKLNPPDMFAIGSRFWPGLSKLAEESGELTNVIGQMLDVQVEPPLALQEMFVEELGDVLAACDFVAKTNDIEIDELTTRERVNTLLFARKGDVNVFTKVAQALGEVVQVIGKLMGTGGEVHHWDGTNLRERLSDSISKLVVIGMFAAKVCDIVELVNERTRVKVATFQGWHDDGMRQYPRD